MNDDEVSFLQRSLDDLERERAAGDLADADYVDLKTRYERKLADVTDSPSPERRRRGRSLVLTVVVVLVVGIGGGLAVAAWSGSRQPGETVTGGVPAATAQQLEKAATLASNGQILDAIKVYDAVLAENPKDTSALTYKGWLLRNVGVESNAPDLAKQGVAYLEKATTIDPKFAPAWLFRGIIYYRDDNDSKRAVDALKIALASDPVPDVATAARGLLSEIQQATAKP